MNYVQWHIGDWESGTRLLSPLEKGIYMDLLMLYYSSETPLIRSKIERITRRYTEDERAAFDYVLGEFFEEREDGFHQSRCDREIALCHEKSEKARKSIQARWTKKAAQDTTVDTNVEQSNSGRTHGEVLTNNQEPITNNHKEESANALPAQASASTPARKRKSSSISSVEKPDDIDAQVWSDWLQIRKAKRLPLTKTAWDAMCIEAEKVGFTPAEAVKYAVERGWASFKAQWVINEEEERNAPKRSSSKTNELQEQFNNNPAYMEANGDWSFTE